MVDFQSLMPLFIAIGVAVIIILIVIVLVKLKNRKQPIQQDPNKDFYKPYKV